MMKASEAQRLSWELSPPPTSLEADLESFFKKVEIYAGYGETSTYYRALLEHRGKFYEEVEKLGYRVDHEDSHFRAYIRW